MPDITENTKIKDSQYIPIKVMTILQAYLNRSKTQKVLSRKPGQEGFSLIELVVVVAVLAILSAIAIPSFVSINDKAKASAAANTVAQIAKECAVQDANNVSSPTFNLPNLSGYTVTPSDGDCDGTSAGTIVATSDTPTKYPTFTYNVTTGAKTCADSSVQQCSSSGAW